MVAVTATTLKNVMDLSISDEQAEYILDLSIDTLNLYGADIGNMTGAAGSKTVTLTSKEKGAVFIAARAIYYGFFKDVEAATVGALAVAAVDLMSNQQVLQTIKEAAQRLEQHEGVPFTVAEASS